jgi:hypothetical protein
MRSGPAGPAEQAAALVSRLPGAGMFWLFLEPQDGRHRFRRGAAQAETRGLR